MIETSITSGRHMPDHLEAHKSASGERLVRVAVAGRREIEFFIDGKPAKAFEGDSVLVALLTNRGFLRRNEFDCGPRAGFCLMGACQDCWVWTADGTRLRACTMHIAAGLHLLTQPSGSTTEHG